MTRRLWQRRTGGTAAGRLDRFVLWCPTVLSVALGMTLCLPGTSAKGLVLFVCILMTVEGVDLLWRHRRSNRPSPRQRRAMEPRSVEPAAASVTDPKSCDVEPPPMAVIPDDMIIDATPESHVTQQFVRSTAEDGTDLFSGWLRVEIPPGGRSTHVHVAFCPPFARTPTIEVNQVDGPTSRIKTVQTLPYGVRLDLKLNESYEEGTFVLLRFSAKADDEGRT